MNKLSIFLLSIFILSHIPYRAVIQTMQEQPIEFGWTRMKCIRENIAGR